MSNERQQMIDGVGRIEQDLDALAADYQAVQSAYRTVSRAAHPDANRQLTLEQTVGMEPLNKLIVRRLRALGLGKMLEQARTPGVVSSLAELQSKIRNQVPR